MFDKNLNFIIGDKNIGKSGFLFQIATICKEVGYKTIFFGSTDEYNYSSTKKYFDLMFFYNSSDDRIIKNIQQIVKSEKFDYIFIDDIDYVLKKDIKEILDINTTKICTCLQNLPQLTDSKIFNLYRNPNELFIKSDELDIDVKNFYKKFQREEKINSII
jgi:thymidine kinase